MQYCFPKPALLVVSMQLSMNFFKARLISNQDLFQMKIENMLISFFTSAQQERHTLVECGRHRFTYKCIASSLEMEQVALQKYSAMQVHQIMLLEQNNEQIFPSKHSDCVRTRISSLMVENQLEFCKYVSNHMFQLEILLPSDSRLLLFAFPDNNYCLFR